MARDGFASVVAPEVWMRSYGLLETSTQQLRQATFLIGGQAGHGVLGSVVAHCGHR
jgi:hypothetical protein